MKKIGIPALNIIDAVAAATAAGRLRGSTPVCLGCTGLPLAFPAHKSEGMFTCGGIRYINSTALHIRAAFERAMAAA